MSIPGYDAWKLATPPEHEGAEPHEERHRCAFCGGEGEPGSPKYCSADCLENALDGDPSPVSESAS